MLPATLHPKAWRVLQARLPDEESRAHLCPNGTAGKRQCPQAPAWSTFSNQGLSPGNHGVSSGSQPQDVGRSPGSQGAMLAPPHARILHVMKYPEGRRSWLAWESCPAWAVGSRGHWLGSRGHWLGAASGSLEFSEKLARPLKPAKQAKLRWA